MSPLLTEKNAIICKRNKAINTRCSNGKSSVNYVTGECSSIPDGEHVTSGKVRILYQY